VAHRARVAAADERRARELQGRARLARVADRGDLGVRRRVVIAHGGVDARAQYGAIADNQSSEGELEVGLYNNDSQIKEVRYREVESDRASYTVTLRELDRPASG
jgi:hypothetical protein